MSLCWEEDTLFRVSLREGDQIVSYSKLKATYQAILDLNLEEKHWTGILTTDNRDSWGTVGLGLLLYCFFSNYVPEPAEASFDERK